MRLAIIIVLCASLIGNVLLGVQVYREHVKNQKLQDTFYLHGSVLNFASLFITKVLRATSEISFEDRLRIENAVRDTKDKDIYEAWQKFVGAKTADDGREEIKNLLQLRIWLSPVANRCSNKVNLLNFWLFSGTKAGG